MNLFSLSLVISARNKPFPLPFREVLDKKPERLPPQHWLPQHAFHSSIYVKTLNGFRNKHRNETEVTQKLWCKREY